MIDFLIKSSVCLLAFLLFYNLILEREKMHHFNRFYLLISVIISLVIPFMTYEIIEIIPAQAQPVFIPVQVLGRARSVQAILQPADRCWYGPHLRRAGSRPTTESAATSVEKLPH